MALELHNQFRVVHSKMAFRPLEFFRVESYGHMQKPGMRQQRAFTGPGYIFIACEPRIKPEGRDVSRENN
jgi:hypothetical protein